MQIIKIWIFDEKVKLLFNYEISGTDLLDGDPIWYGSEFLPDSKKVFSSNNNFIQVNEQIKSLKNRSEVLKNVIQEKIEWVDNLPELIRNNEKFKVKDIFDRIDDLPHTNKTSFPYFILVNFILFYFSRISLTIKIIL